MKDWKKVVISPTETLSEALRVLQQVGLQISIVADNNFKILGTVTDGDIRRMLEKSEKFNHLLAENIMTFNPIIVSSETLAVEALRIMEEKKIGQLIIINVNRKYINNTKEFRA